MKKENNKDTTPDWMVNVFSPGFFFTLKKMKIIKKQIADVKKRKTNETCTHTQHMSIDYLVMFINIIIT